MEISFPSNKKDAAGVVTNLKKIRKLLTPRENWIKSQETDGHGHYCLIGATNHIDGPLREETHNFIHSFLKFKLDDDGINVEDFNDDSKTTHAKVLAMLDKSIKVAEGLRSVL